LEVAIARDPNISPALIPDHGFANGRGIIEGDIEEIKKNRPHFEGD
jgi:hypothetical protein